jgi:two-component system, NtrC family, response regulator AtoC
MAEVRHRAEKICQMNVPVLLCGPGGTGKEALARWIHAHSPYREGQFVKVNCAAIPGTLLESELFGYEKGAFTGAQHAKPGRVEMAHGGTLFLDEIADLDPALQSKLLHFLQDGCFSRIGDHSQRTVDTRVMCATHSDLESEILAGRFRADLYYRINVVQLRLPKLGERREDIPEIAQYFRQFYEKQFAKESEPLSRELLGYVQNSDWPGNVRELSNSIARYVLIGPEAFIAPPAVKRRMEASTNKSGNGAVPLKIIAKDAIRQMERNVILEALRAHQWNRRKTAEALKISYRALIYKIRDAGLGSRRANMLPARGAAPLAHQPSSD